MRCCLKKKKKVTHLIIEHCSSASTITPILERSGIYEKEIVECMITADSSYIRLKLPGIFGT